MSLKATSDLWWKNAIFYCLDVEVYADSDLIDPYGRSRPAGWPDAPAQRTRNDTVSATPSATTIQRSGRSGRRRARRAPR